MTQDLLDAYKAKSGKRSNNVGQGEDEDSDDALIDEVMYSRVFNTLKYCKH